MTLQFGHLSWLPTRYRAAHFWCHAVGLEKIWSLYSYLFVMISMTFQSKNAWNWIYQILSTVFFSLYVDAFLMSLPFNFIFWECFINEFYFLEQLYVIP